MCVCGGGGLGWVGCGCVIVGHITPDSDDTHKGKQESGYTGREMERMATYRKIVALLSRSPTYILYSQVERLLPEYRLSKKGRLYTYARAQYVVVWVFYLVYNVLTD